MSMSKRNQIEESKELNEKLQHSNCPKLLKTMIEYRVYICMMFDRVLVSSSVIAKKQNK